MYEPNFDFRPWAFFWARTPFFGLFGLFKHYESDSFSSFKHVLMGITLCFGQYNNVLLAMNTPSIYLSFESELYPKGPPIVPKRPTEFIILI